MYISIYLFIHIYKYNIYQVVPSISIPSISFRLSTWLFRRVALRGAQVNKASSPKYSPAKVAGGGSSYLDVPLEPRLGELYEFVGRSERAKNKVLNELPLIQARPKGLHIEYRRILRFSGMGLKPSILFWALIHPIDFLPSLYPSRSAFTVWVPSGKLR